MASIRETLLSSRPKTNMAFTLMLNGSKNEVKNACRECLEALAPCGGLILGDGANVCPGTPLENLAAFTEATEEFGAVGSSK